MSPAPTALAASMRAGRVPPFHAMVMGALASEREAAGHRVMHLQLGQPSTSAPAGALAVAVQALQRQPLGYTNAAGLMSLRRRIARHYDEWYGVQVPVERVMVVAGASAGFSLAFLACFDAGQRVGVLEPGYPCYRNALLALDIEPVPIPVGAGSRWAPTAEMLDGAGHLDGLIVASPSNPTGTVLSPAAMALLGSHCREHGIRLISDEIYHGITYNGPAATMLEHSNDAVVINSFSKYFSMTGWRLGWVVTPDALTDAFERLQQNLYICAPHVSQVVGLAAFDHQPELDAHVDRYRANRGMLLDGLAAAGITQVAEADGAFYVYADVSHLGDDSMVLCRRWLDELGVAATPGLDFDTTLGHRSVRFSYAGSADDIAEACTLLAGWAP
ncbi:MAG: aminotransferase class I/II-fold pyridoxal phosphate-dependent enzyme [Actinobacteria bacterium]|nr:aminotransferase class I/II-fold pyridoxal phosphate-dependent enzyme [Actinomycetota bacterium]